MWPYIAAFFIMSEIDKSRNTPAEVKRAENKRFVEFLVKWVFLPFAVLCIVGWMIDQVSAQTTNHTFRDANGRSIGRSSTDLRGNTTYYDSMGRNTGRSSTDSRGNTTIYNERGQQTGRISK